MLQGKAFHVYSYWFLFASGYLMSAVRLAIQSNHGQAIYRFTTCGSRDREGPTYMECTERYCNSGSLVCGHLLNEGTRGSQIFVVPRSGNYTVTIAGASGGHGVCSNYSGLGVIARETVQFRRGEILRILVGQQGISACDGHQDVDICQISNDTEACETLWKTNYSNSEYQLFDGGGGGGGASLLQYNVLPLNDHDPIVVSPGGGGAGTVYNATILFPLLDIMYDDSDDLDALYRNYTYGHPFNSFPVERDDVLIGASGSRTYLAAPGPGAGYLWLRTIAVIDPDPLSSDGFGGIDCHVPILITNVPFPHTHGGFGGGGGGCEGGGGGAGYTGGAILANGSAFAGEGGYAWPDPPWPFIGYNDGDGYVELFLESCGCTYNCIIYNQSSFECSCPSDTLLALNGFDCYTEEHHYFESEEDPVLFFHPTYGEITANIVHLNSIVFAYSIAVVFNNDNSSSTCAVLFIDRMGNLIATTKFVKILSEKIQRLELFTATTVIVNTSTMVSAYLSTNSELMLEEPLSVASVITFGIEGDCILDELIVDASIDDIYEFESDVMLNLTSTEVLQAFLDSFTRNITTIDSSDDASSGVIVGIICAIVVLTIVALIILAVYIYLRKYSNSQYKLSLMQFIKDKHAKTDENVESYITAADNQYEKFIHEYERVDEECDGVSDVEMTAMKKTGIALKYGYKAPLQDYHKFNCSRQNDDWNYDRSQLIYMRKIGEGNFGKVLLMKAKDICGVKGSVFVAVKTLTSTDLKDIQRFSEEMDLMKKFIHPNIVSLLGSCDAISDGAPMMILELMQYGDLKWFLKSNKPTKEKSSVVTDSVAIDIVTDVATALEYLTANKYVHRDVAARNCLIGEGFKAKLSDFGLARGVQESDYYKIAQKTALPVRWMAPESLLYGKFTSASDVWSFGVLVWEVTTHAKTPHEKLKARDIIEMAGNGTLKLESPDGCLGILGSIISQCTRIESEDRPTFTEILEWCDKKNLPAAGKQSSTVKKQHKT